MPTHAGISHKYDVELSCSVALPFAHFAPWSTGSKQETEILAQVKLTSYKVPLWDVVNLKSRGCRKLKMGSIIFTRRPYVLRVLLYNAE